MKQITAKTFQDYMAHPTKALRQYILRQQKLEKSLGDEGARERLTRQWLARQQEYRQREKIRQSQRLSR